MKINHFSLLLCFILYQGNLLAQNDSKTLFGDSGLVNTSNLGFFVAPSYRFIVSKLLNNTGHDLINRYHESKNRNT